MLPLLLAIIAGLAAVPHIACAAESTEIAVLLRDRAGRDADLDLRPLEPAEVELLEAAAAVGLLPTRLQDNGAQVLAVSGGADGPRLRALLAGLRGLPEVVYADRVIRVEEATPPPGGTLDRIIVKLRDPASRDASDAARPMPQEKVRELSRIAGVSLFHERPVSGGAYALRLFQKMPDASVTAIAKRLSQDPSVAYAEPTVRGRFQARPNDPLYADQWPLFDSAGGVNAPGAWKRTRGSADVVVAILDSGIRPEHPDLRGRLLPGYDFVSDVRRSNDFDGRDADPTDPGDATFSAECAIGAPATVSTWHGTHVAGTVGAATDNRTGVAGVDWKARILPVRVGAKCGIDPIDLVDAIRWSAGALEPGVRIADVGPGPATPARILNLSMEFPGACPQSLQDAITDAVAAGALVVAAAGNAGQPAGGFHPANCQGVLVVHGNDAAGAHAAYSNYGDVDVSAPGGSTSMDVRRGILSTVVAGRKTAGAPDYAFKEGTSMAAPMVAGVASLALSVAPDLTPGNLHTLLEATSRPFPVGTGADCSDSGSRSCGAGIVDAGAAVAAAAAVD
ncbi:MAG: S8 family peptidase [Candidatus Binatia bacterium]|nr:S8 family peptidase [Candidatus Binatia bacterium]